jgi:hypothetical protein
MESLKQLVDISKDIDVRIHTIYGNVIHNPWAAFEQNWESLQRQLDQYLTVANSIRQLCGVDSNATIKTDFSDLERAGAAVVDLPKANGGSWCLRPQPK